MNTNQLDEDVFDQPVKSKFRVLPIIFWLMLLLLGSIFRLQHLPGASILMATATGGLLGFLSWKVVESRLRYPIYLVLLGLNVIGALYLILSLYPSVTSGLNLLLVMGFSFVLYRKYDQP